MPHIKITEPGFAGFTGNIGSVEWVNGVSVDPLPQSVIDRVAGIMRVEGVVVGDDGSTEADGEQQGAQARLKDLEREVAPVDPGLKRATEKDLEAEEKLLRQKGGINPADKIYTQAELEAVAEKGIVALREIGDAWGVRGRRIADLIIGILEAQERFRELQAKKAATAKKIVETSPTPVEEDLSSARIFVDGVLVDPNKVIGGDEPEAPAEAPVETEKPVENVEAAAIAQKQAADQVDETADAPTSDTAE